VMDLGNKVKIGLIFSLDYEIHGNGSGDFESWAYYPTTQMLNVFDSCNAKLTIMAEMGHYWAMQRYRESFSREILLFESQLKNAIERGHDVQLHFHPQWIDATYKDGNWLFDFNRKTIERICHNYDEAYFYLNKGKNDLQNLLTVVNPQYQCIGFRAGFLQIQPSGNVLKALSENGFLSDTSVSKGMKANDNLRLLDFSSAYSRYLPWKTSNQEICNKDEAGKILEFPILSQNTPIINKITKKILKRTGELNIRDLISFFMASFGKGMPSASKMPLAKKVRNIVADEWSYVDFCLRDPSYLIKQIKIIVADCKKNRIYNYVPVVLIAHSKDFFFSNNLEIFLKACSNIEGVEFTTYAGAIQKKISDLDKNLKKPEIV
jgi:hypothetical protein